MQFIIVRMRTVAAVQGVFINYNHCRSFKVYSYFQDYHLAFLCYLVESQQSSDVEDVSQAARSRTSGHQEMKLSNVDLLPTIRSL